MKTHHLNGAETTVADHQPLQRRAVYTSTRKWGATHHFEIAGVIEAVRRTLVARSGGNLADFEHAQLREVFDREHEEVRAHALFEQNRLQFGTVRNHEGFHLHANSVLVVGDGFGDQLRLVFDHDGGEHVDAQSDAIGSDRD